METKKMEREGKFSKEEALAGISLFSTGTMHSLKHRGCRNEEVFNILRNARDAADALLDTMETGEDVNSRKDLWQILEKTSDLLRKNLNCGRCNGCDKK